MSLKKSASFNEALPVRPESATAVWVGCISLLGFLGMLYLSIMQKWHPYVVIWMSSLGILIPALGYEAIKSSSLMRPRPENLEGHAYRVNLKRIGMVATFSGWVSVAWLFPYYGEHGSRIWELFTYPIVVLENLGWQTSWIIATGMLVVLAVDRYIVYTDRCLLEPRDGLFTLGAWLLRRKADINQKILKQHFLQWTVKIFFLPLMLSAMYGNVAHMSEKNWAVLIDMIQDPLLTKSELFIYNFDVIKLILFTIDLGFALVGYACTLKLFGTHTRSAESTVWGWLVCVICYAPFHSVINNSFLKFRDNVDYSTLWTEHPTLCVIWAGTIIALLTIYTFATVQFGVRFSNLTHRGILTTGVYGWTKHPAYIAKNAMWWIIFIPFGVTLEWTEALLFCIHLVFRNLLYYWRAKTEEKHLGQDETYQQYANWIAEYGVAARLARLVKGRPAAPTLLKK